MNREAAVKRGNCGDFGVAGGGTSQGSARGPELRAVLEINRAVTSSATRDDVFRAIATSLAGMIDFSFMVVLVRGPRPDEFSQFAYTDCGIPSPLPADARYPMDEGPAGVAMTTGEPFVVRHRDELAEFPDAQSRMELFDVHSVLAFPLVFDGEATACLLLASPDPGRFTQSQIGILEMLSDSIAVAVKNCLDFEELTRLRERLTRENDYLKSAAAEATEHRIVGSSPAIRRVLASAERVAPTDATVLLTGETGTGKGLMARLIHDASHRRDGMFVSVNCAAITPSLAESELFGHERGAFTSATRRVQGRFEVASGGTIFLDEVGDLPLGIQAKLLHVIQHGEFERVGSSESISTDARIIAATNHDLHASVQQGRFRADLYYRLSVFPIHMPPLRHRREDLHALIDDIVARTSKALRKQVDGFAPGALAGLMGHSWPGNVRELENLIERAIIVADSPLLRLPPQGGAVNEEPAIDIKSLDEVQRSHIEAALVATRGVIDGPAGAAHLLGIKPSTLRARMNKLGVVRPSG